MTHSSVCWIVDLLFTPNESSSALISLSLVLSLFNPHDWTLGFVHDSQAPQHKHQASFHCSFTFLLWYLLLIFCAHVCVLGYACVSAHLRVCRQVCACACGDRRLISGVFFNCSSLYNMLRQSLFWTWNSPFLATLASPLTLGISYFFLPLAGTSGSCHIHLDFTWFLGVLTRVRFLAYKTLRLLGCLPVH